MIRVTPFLRGRVYWARVPRLELPAVQRSLGTEDADIAKEICVFLRWLKGRRESFLLDAIAAGQVSVGAAYTAYAENRLDRFIVEQRDGISDTDLEPYVAKWAKAMQKDGRPAPSTQATYLRQVRTLIEAGKPFPRSLFTKQRIREHLGSLPKVGQPNRYRAALSSFAKFLLFEDVLTLNPVVLVPMKREREPRALHLTQDEARRLVEAFPKGKIRTLHAAMLATGMEFGAAAAIRAGDVKETTAYAAGTKRAHRRRTVMIYPRWQWAWDIVRADLKHHLPASTPFADVTHDHSHRALKRALAVANLPADYTQHDHRHTWAVQAIRDGLALHTVAHQLGHRDATMVLKVYGRYQPQASDFDRNATVSATPTKKTGTSE